MLPLVDLPKRKPLLAVILEAEAALPAAALDRALRAWHVRREQGVVVPFGQVLLTLGLMTPARLRPYLALQRKLAVPKGAKRPLGTLLLELGFVKPRTLLEAREHQAEVGGPLGEALRAIGAVNGPQLAYALRHQGRYLAA